MYKSINADVNQAKELPQASAQGHCCTCHLSTQASFHWFSRSVLPWGSRLALQLNPSTFLFGFLLFLIIFLHMFQEVILALRVLNMLNRHINSLGKNLALVCLQWYQQHAGQHCRFFQVCHGNICGAFLFEQCPFPWYLQYHCSCRAISTNLLYLDSYIHFYTFPITSYFSHQFEAHSQTIYENRKVCFIYYF